MTRPIFAMDFVAAPEHIARYVWVVTRHEIDYRGNVGVGEIVTAETFIPEPPRGAQFDRCVAFRDSRGKRIVAWSQSPAPCRRPSP